MMPMPAMTPTPSPFPDEHTSSGGRLVSTDGRELPLRATALSADARGGIARTVLEQRFENPFDEPLRVTYQVPLPADGAVSGYAFRIGDRRIVGTIDRKAAARERFETAILEGRTAALLEEDRSSLFTEEVGNIPPRTEVVVELTVDQPLRWLDEGAWEWRFPTVVAPRYLGAERRVADAARVTVDVADQPLPVRASLALRVHDATTAAPASPSHAITDALSSAQDAQHLLVFRDERGARLDRDVVVRWAVARPEVGASLAVARSGAEAPHADCAYGLLTLVPPERTHRGEPLARDLILLLDTSGSMHGEPLAQARRIGAALIDTLGERDRLEMVAFASGVERWKRRPVAMDRRGRERALGWLASRRADGGTEMRSGILEALSTLRPDAQRQVILVTDGLIGFEEEIVREILDRLPRGCRVHTVGVGSGVNRTLTRGAARAGRGEEVILGIGEDPERAARRLCARTDAPLVVDLELSGEALVEHAPAKLPDLFAGAPALVSLRLRPEGGLLRVRGKTAFGVWEQRLEVPAAAPDVGEPAVATLYGRERVEDLETRRAAGGEVDDVDAAIEALGLRFSIATRLTSFIAIADEVSVDPGDPSRRVPMPHELPHGMSAEGVGLRPAMFAVAREDTGEMPLVLHEAALDAAAPPRAKGEQTRKRAAPGGLGRVFSRGGRPPMPNAPPAPPAPAPTGAPPPRHSAPTLGRSELPPPPAGSAGAPPAPRREIPIGAPPHEPSRPDFDLVDEEMALPRSLRGKVVLRTADRLVIEVLVDGADLDWHPPAEAVVEVGKRGMGCAIDARHTTRAATIGAGRVLRVALAYAGDDAPDRVVIDLPSGVIVIDFP